MSRKRKPDEEDSLGEESPTKNLHSRMRPFDSYNPDLIQAVMQGNGNSGGGGGSVGGGGGGYTMMTGSSGMSQMSMATSPSSMPTVTSSSPSFNAPMNPRYASHTSSSQPPPRMSDPTSLPPPTSLPSELDNLSDFFPGFSSTGFGHARNNDHSGNGGLQRGHDTTNRMANPANRPIARVGPNPTNEGPDLSSDLFPYDFSANPMRMPQHSSMKHSMSSNGEGSNSHSHFFPPSATVTSASMQSTPNRHSSLPTFLEEENLKRSPPEPSSSGSGFRGRTDSDSPIAGPSGNNSRSPSSIKDEPGVSSTNGGQEDSSGSSNSKKDSPTVPEEERDESYWEKRRKNNESAKRSRENRRNKEAQISIHVLYMENENLALRTEIDVITKQNREMQEEILKLGYRQPNPGPRNGANGHYDYSQAAMGHPNSLPPPPPSSSGGNMMI